jgi:acetyl-CoA C-acetyltransferase
LKRESPPLTGNSEMSREVVIASAVRTAIGRLNGALSEINISELGTIVIREAITRANIDPGQVDEVIMGTMYYTGDLPSNLARAVAIRAGIPLEVPAFTLSKHCGASMRAVTLAAQIIKAHEADIIVAGGMESMSRAAYILKTVRKGYRLGHGVLIDPLVQRGDTRELRFDPTCELGMGETAEKLASIYKIPREKQDLFALRSQQKAERAIKSGRFKEEIVPIEIPKGKGELLLFDTDEGPRFGCRIEDLVKLRPVFKQDGTVTAGNACGMNDAGVALVIMAKEKALSMGITPLATIKSYASVGVDPTIMGIGPVYATRKVLGKIGLSLKDMDLIELNEAFAAQVLAVFAEMPEFKDQEERINPNGGAIAFGHPISATGGIIMTKLLYEMKREDLKYGLATMCIGGGQGIAVVVEREQGAKTG